MPVLDHLHTYERIKDRPEYFKCIHPLCYHFIHKDLLELKKAMCRCGDSFILNREELKKKSPKCSNCIKTRNRKSNSSLRTEEIAGVIEDLIAETPSSTAKDENDKSYEL